MLKYIVLEIVILLGSQIIHQRDTWFSYYLQYSQFQSKDDSQDSTTAPLPHHLPHSLKKIPPTSAKILIHSLCHPSSFQPQPASLFANAAARATASRRRACQATCARARLVTLPAEASDAPLMYRGLGSISFAPVLRSLARYLDVSRKFDKIICQARRSGFRWRAQVERAPCGAE